MILPCPRKFKGIVLCDSQQAAAAAPRLRSFYYERTDLLYLGLAFQTRHSAFVVGDVLCLLRYQLSDQAVLKRDYPRWIGHVAEFVRVDRDGIGDRHGQERGVN